MNILEKDNLKYAVIGSGSWATAQVKMMLNHQPSISWYMRDEENIKFIGKYGHNKRYLQSVEFDPSRLKMTTDVNEAVAATDVIIFCVPSAYFMNTIKNLNVHLDEKFIVSAIKGFVEVDGKYLTIAEYFHQIHKIPFDRIGIVSGPCHAEEVGMERLSYLTLTSKHLATASLLCNAFECDYIRTTPGTDIYGVEYSAALKNIYAVAAGICHGLGYGDNFMAVLMTNSFHEMTEFINVTHPDRNRRITTSPYLGDLLVTGYSQFSRNRTFGNMIGKGYSVRSAQIEMSMIAEGYYASNCINAINKIFRVDMPIAEAVYEILYEQKYPAYVIKRLTEKLH